MQKYSLLFGIMGILAGLGLIFYSLISPKTPKVIAPLPPETLIYNVGTAHELPGTDAMLYENTALGIRFGYPQSYGDVIVEKRDGGVFFSFSQSGATNDPKRTFFMTYQYLKPEGHAKYWGDLSWYANPNPRWVQEENVCALLAGNADVDSTGCANIPFGEGGIAKLKDGGSSTYLIPAFQTTNDNLVLDMFAASDARLLNKDEFENPVGNIEKLVKSIEFIEATP